MIFIHLFRIHGCCKSICLTVITSYSISQQQRVLLIYIIYAMSTMIFVIILLLMMNNIYIYIYIPLEFIMCILLKRPNVFCTFEYSILQIKCNLYIVQFSNEVIWLLNVFSILFKYHVYHFCSNLLLLIVIYLLESSGK